MIRCIIVDDETPAREELKYLLNDFDRVEIVGEASHGKEAIELNNRLKPDLVFFGYCNATVKWHRCSSNYN